MQVFEVDVAIVGAGLGGLSAAISLAQQGKTVALFERDELGRHKVCGEFISPESRAIFRDLGVLEPLEAAGARPIVAARISTSGRVGREIPLPAAGLAISRHLSDPILWAHAQNLGVLCHQKTRVETVRRDGAHFELQTANFRCRARFVVAATGRNGRHFGAQPLGAHPLGAQPPGVQPPGVQPPGVQPRRFGRKTRKYMGLKTHFRGVKMAEDEAQMFSYEGGYCGVVRVEGDRANVCALVDYERSRGKTPAQIWDSLLAENRNLKGLLGDARPDFPWIATGNVSFGHFTPTSDDILRVGDAAGYIHPLSGDGMAMAIRSGQLAAQAIESASDAAEAAARYAKLWHEEFHRRLSWTRWLQPLITHRKWALPALAFFDFAPAVMQKIVVATRQK